MIDVVLDERNAIGRAQILERPLQELIAGDVVGDDVAQMQAFGRRVFDVAHVEIEPAAVEEETAVARRLFVIAVMKIDRAGLRFAEQIILHPHRPGIGVGAAFIAADEAAVFGFDAGDAIHPDQWLSRA